MEYIIIELKSGSKSDFANPRLAFVISGRYIMLTTSNQDLSMQGRLFMFRGQTSYQGTHPLQKGKFKKWPDFRL